MKKIYRILTLISFLLLIGIIIFFVLKISPKIKTKIYKQNNDYFILLNTNKLNNKRSTITINNEDYQTNLTVVFEKENFYFYYLSIHNLDIELNNNIDAFVYLPNTSLFNYLTKKM